MPNLRVLTTSCVGLELRPLPSPGITRLQRYYEPLRHPSAPGLSLAGVRLIIPDHALGLPVLRALSLCTCCRHYPGAAAGRNPRSSHPAIAAFPDSAVGSACTSTFSRVARRSLALRPAHSRGHQVVTAIRRLQPFRYLHDCSDCFRLERTPGGSCTTGKRRLFTAHADSGRSGGGDRVVFYGSFNSRAKPPSAPRFAKRDQLGFSIAFAAPLRNAVHADVAGETRGQEPCPPNSPDARSPSSPSREIANLTRVSSPLGRRRRSPALCFHR